MRKEIRRRHEAYVRAQSVCAEHSAFFDATAGGRKARTALATQMAEVDRLLVLQDRSRSVAGRQRSAHCKEGLAFPTDLDLP
jgi:hypothetical protein